MPQGTHAVGWGCRENGERVRAYCTHTLHAGCYTTCFPCRTLNPQQPPHPLSPWERVRERATSHKACIWSVRVLGKVAEIRGVPSPQPSPTGGGGRLPKFGACPLPSPPPRGEGEGCSRFRRCRSSEKECPKYQQQEFFR